MFNSRPTLPPLHLNRRGNTHGNWGNNDILHKFSRAHVKHFLLICSRHSSPTWCSGFMFEGNGRETKTKKYETKVEKDMHERRKEHERTRHVPKRTLMNAKRKPGKARQYTKRIPKNATGNARKHTKSKPRRTRKWETKPGKARKDTKRKPRTRKWETKPQEKHERTPNESRGRESEKRNPRKSTKGHRTKGGKHANQCEAKAESRERRWKEWMFKKRKSNQRLFKTDTKLRATRTGKTSNRRDFSGIFAGF